MIDGETVSFYDRAAERFAKLDAGENPTPELADFIDRLAPGASVLDLGCGPGISCAHFAAAGFDVTGLDASEALLDVARRIAPAAHFVVAGFEGLDAVDTYDGIWVNFSLHHATRDALPDHFAAIADALRARGLVYLSMLAGTGEERDGEGRLYTYVTEAELLDLANTVGLKGVATRSLTTVGPHGGTAPALAMILEKLS